MIEGHEKFRIGGEKNGGIIGDEFYIEVNFDGDDKCERLKITFPDGKFSIIRKEHLNAILFAIGTEAEQRKMIPQVERRSRWYETHIEVVAKKNIKKGEKISFPLKITLPTFEEEVIAEAKRDVIKSNYPLLG